MKILTNTILLYNILNYNIGIYKYLKFFDIEKKKISLKLDSIIKNLNKTINRYELVSNLQ